MVKKKALSFELGYTREEWRRILAQMGNGMGDQQLRKVIQRVRTLIQQWQSDTYLILPNLDWDEYQILTDAREYSLRESPRSST